MWTGECHVQHNNRKNILVWSRAGEEWLNDCLRGTVKSGRFSITIWSCVGWKGVGQIRTLEGRINPEKHQNFLEYVWHEINSFGKHIVFQDR